MPCISVQYNPDIGPLIQVAVLPASIGVDARAVPDDYQPKFYMALADTGASSTCISPKVVADLGLLPMGKMPVAGVHGSVPTNTYQFNVGIYFTQRAEASGIVSGQMFLAPVFGTEFVNAGTAFDVLLGRDVLCRGMMSLSFDGRFTLCL
jgi:hypothetical protein